MSLVNQTVSANKQAPEGILLQHLRQNKSKELRLKLMPVLLSVALNFFSPIHAQNPLVIPPALSGTVFNLNVKTGSVSFYPGHTTNTYGVNGDILAPTLILNKGDSVTINVTNNLPEKTTMHWHGFHVPPHLDGGPHQIINKGATWSPRFKVLNDAATLWYHPHGHMSTERQVVKGVAGMAIIKDAVEAGYNLPRTYGTDDIPLIVQSKAFDVLYQLAPATEYDSVVLVNGVMKPYFQAPQQVVRFRLLNGSASRTFMFGLEDNSDFYLIASDGGLLDKPHKLKRISLSPGERAEMLVDFSSYTIGQSVFLKSFSSELKKGVIGADSVGTAQFSLPGYYDNALNGADYNVLRFDVVAATANPVTSIPAAFSPLTPFTESQSNFSRHLHFSPDTLSISGQAAYVDGPFLINGTTFHMDTINQVVYKDDIEIWKLTNKTMIAHPFHIHDIEFYVLDINRQPPPVQLSGKKDVILVEPYDTIRFITKFDDFADEHVPYMYHCHLLHHEDEGMMGTFIVMEKGQMNILNPVSATENARIVPNPLFNQTARLIFGNKAIKELESVVLTDIKGKTIRNYGKQSLQEGVLQLNLPDKLESGCYFMQYNGPMGQGCLKLMVVADGE